MMTLLLSLRKTLGQYFQRLTCSTFYDRCCVTARRKGAAWMPTGQVLCERPQDRRCVTAHRTGVVWPPTRQELCDRLQDKCCVTVHRIGVAWMPTGQVLCDRPQDRCCVTAHSPSQEVQISANSTDSRCPLTYTDSLYKNIMSNNNLTNNTKFFNE